MARCHFDLCTGSQCQNQSTLYSTGLDQFSFYTHCLNGTLTEALLINYLNSNPNTSVNTPMGDKRLTPLALACEGGHTNTVQVLLECKADADAVSARRRPPLYFATTRAQRNRVEIVRLLLEGGAAIDKRFPEDHDATAIMNAITEVQDKAVVRELVARGASLYAENASGQSVWVLAREYGMEEELGPLIPKPQVGPGCSEPGTQCGILTNVVMALVMLVARHADDESIRDIVAGAAESMITGTSNTAHLMNMSQRLLAKVAHPGPTRCHRDGTQMAVNTEGGHRHCGTIALPHQYHNQVGHHSTASEPDEIQASDGIALGAGSTSGRVERTLIDRRGSAVDRDEVEASIPEPHGPSSSNGYESSTDESTPEVDAGPTTAPQSTAPVNSAGSAAPAGSLEPSVAAESVTSDSQGSEDESDDSVSEDIPQTPIEPATVPDLPRPEEGDTDSGSESEQGYQTELDGTHEAAGPAPQDPPADVGRDTATQPLTTVDDIKLEIDSDITRAGFGKFYDDDFVNTVARNAADLRRQGSVLSKPENVQRLVKLALYHPIFYCDNSTSMSQDGRFQTQRDLVVRMADIATKIAPGGYDVDLHFINDSKPDARKIVTKEELVDALENTVLQDKTRIGTVLGSHILKPLVTDKLKTKAGLSRPLLICIITDGCPTAEPPETFRSKVEKCKQRLKKKGYTPASVMFCISQIGDDPNATGFLDDLEKHEDIHDVLHRTTDRLHEKYEKLKDNHDKLDEWLLEVLTNPIVMRLPGRS